MHRGSVVVIVLSLAMVAAACSSRAPDPDKAGTCTIKPGVVCRDKDLRNVSLVAANLAGADFSGADLRSSDLRDADLTGAKFVGALLGGVNFAGATLKDADLTKANLFFTNFTDADVTGMIQTGAYECNVTRPNGGLNEGACPSSAGGIVITPTGKPPTGPPVIESFALSPPGRCLNDAAGQGIEVDYATKNATSLTFSIDGLRIDAATKPRGTKRLPFICDGQPHTATMQAFGTINPTASMSFTTGLNLTAPQAPGGG